MLLRKTAWFWKSGLAVISFVLMFSISGCSDTPPEEDTVSETVIDVQDVSEEEQENEEEIINICIELYDKAAEENKLDDLEIIRSIVNRLGENGYPAVDSRNQVNMTEAEQVLEFCKKVDAQEEAELTILEISYLGGFVKYDLHTKDGNVDVVRSYYGYENGGIQKEVTGRYQAEYWNYTEEGYLMFSGVWFSEELYILTLSGVEEHTALRVQPLDETYRELSRKYLNSISFERNNMFIVDWREEDFGDLNFYDMYDILYPIIARMPTSHIPNSMYPMLDGVSLFTERAKSFIQPAFPAGLIPAASPMAVLVPEVGELFRLLSHERICGNPIKRNGIKGTTNNPSSRNHKLYCIRLDRLPLNIRLAIKRIPMIPLINTLHIKKRIIKSAMLITSFF